MPAFIVAISGGALLGAGFIIPALWPLSFFGIIPLVALARDARSLRDTALFGWLAGFILSACAIGAVFWGILPLDWLGVYEPSLQIVYLIFAWLLTAGVMAFSTAVFVVALRMLLANSWRDALLIPSLWVISEALGAFFFHAVSFGSGGHLSIDFSLAFIGYQLADDRVILQASWAGGVFALSFIGAAVGAVLWRIWHATNMRERAAFGVVLAALFGAWALGHTLISPEATQVSANAPARTFALVTTNITKGAEPTPEDLKSYKRRQMALALRGASSAEFVVLPEGAEFLSKFRWEGTEITKENAREVLGFSGPVVLDSQEVLEPGGRLRWRHELFDTESGESVWSGKWFLLPMGEFLPYAFRYGLGLFGSNSETFNNMLLYNQLSSGAYPYPVLSRGIKLALLACNETMSPTLYASLARSGAEVFINQASHLWFHSSPLVFHQMLRTAKVRAAESRRWYAQASNATASFVLDERGRVAAQTAFATEDVFVARLPLSSEKTPYAFSGAWVLLVPLLIVSAAINRVRGK